MSLERADELMLQDKEYMSRAIELAKKGEGWVNPNPKVGAVIVKDGQIIGEGYHVECGQMHAERCAISSLRDSAEGATMYVTMEPCCHYGKTPPCTEAIIENEISRVIIGSRDPNPKVSGKGAQTLRDAGIEVVEDFMKDECDALNSIFFHYITTNIPYIRLKYAMTADGKIATKTGASRWVTGPEAIHKVHEMRHECMSIMVGVDTVIADDPMLNCRIENGRNPIRIICDSKLRIPGECQLVRTADEYDSETIVVCAVSGMPLGEVRFSEKAPFYMDDYNENPLAKALGKKFGGGDFTKKAIKLNERGVRIFNFPGHDGKVDLSLLMEYLGKLDIDSLLLEGGGNLNESALRAGIINEIRIFIAPKVFGGKAKSPIEGIGVDHPNMAYKFSFDDVERIGSDLMITCKRIDNLGTYIPEDGEN
nr:bifunctional diaminohydroxyphosphoribosylaminopyrimidine deaminase/5-amino-6-(5-phosphoribosylamino)uracil reductase RibD [uncultured Mogibacterium sp.]